MAKRVFEPAMQDQEEEDKFDGPFNMRMTDPEFLESVNAISSDLTNDNMTEVGRGANFIGRQTSDYQSQFEFR